MLTKTSRTKWAHPKFENLKNINYAYMNANWNELNKMN